MWVFKFYAQRNIHKYENFQLYVLSIFSLTTVMNFFFFLINSSHANKKFGKVMTRFFLTKYTDMLQLNMDQILDIFPT